ncbi:hypothetical protein VaNZ11_001997 [Volvox africanus]|uniref:Peptidase M14 domain-containing protein n=1 Tax=Volvox africanus TaxID=51714 RepID=A0ABQ5RQY8_9CHLO|nr:hypothetical protein VaNZ11_001997 [Volvox africanus]
MCVLRPVRPCLSHSVQNAQGAQVSSMRYIVLHVLSAALWSALVCSSLHQLVGATSPPPQVLLREGAKLRDDWQEVLTSMIFEERKAAAQDDEPPSGLEWEPPNRSAKPLAPPLRPRPARSSSKWPSSLQRPATTPPLYYTSPPPQEPPELPTLPLVPPPPPPPPPPPSPPSPLLPHSPSRLSAWARSPPPPVNPASADGDSSLDFSVMATDIVRTKKTPPPPPPEILPPPPRRRLSPPPSPPPLQPMSPPRLPPPRRRIPPPPPQTPGNPLPPQPPSPRRSPPSPPPPRSRRAPPPRRPAQPPLPPAPEPPSWPETWYPPPTEPDAPSPPPRPPPVKSPKLPKAFRNAKPPPSPTPPGAPIPPAINTFPSDLSMDWGVLPTYKRISEFLLYAAENSEGRCAVSSLGKSVKGRDIWLVTVGNPTEPTFPDPTSPDVPFPKPKFAVIGNMHGDEKGNVQVLLQFISEICLKPSDPRVQNLIDTTALYIVPSMNPDGYVATDRMNANGIDLNRNCYSSDFPFARPSPSVAMKGAYYEAAYFLTSGGASMEPETKVVTSWLGSIRPTVSSNLHGGALVSGFTLDACDSLGVRVWCESRDDPLPNFLANIYAQNHPRMFFSKTDPQGLGTFINGTTQGANWYPALGTLADWLHHAQRLHMLTLELHNRKLPTGNDLLTMYGYNRASLLRLAEAAHVGFRARLLDAVTGAPLRADVTMDNPNNILAPQVEDGGYIWKLGLPGSTYTCTILPYDPNDTSVRYAPIQLTYTVPSSFDEVIKGSGTDGLSVVKVLWASRL